MTHWFPGAYSSRNNQFYDGGEGNFDALTYASDPFDVLQREYINDGIRSKARSQEASGPVQIFAETGRIERMSADAAPHRNRHRR
ncbi:MAG: hypothetical protein H6937_03255 [Burkholderiales bacterium]|nr:hypothetical protein [Burkholderiales bacterium]